MADVVLFHHVQGVTDGVRAFADRLRGAGHAVYVPDLFDGETFATIDDGMAHVRETGGFAAMLERGVDASSRLPDDVVYAGFSMGVMPAQKLAQTRTGARAAVFIDGCLFASEFGDGWPEGLAVQVHGMDADPFFAEEGGDIDAARALAAESDRAELFLYEGSVHLFADSSLDVHDPEATDLLVRRVVALLDGLGEG